MDHLIFAHHSAESGHAVVLEALGADPLLDPRHAPRRRQPAPCWAWPLVQAAAGDYCATWRASNPQGSADGREQSACGPNCEPLALAVQFSYPGACPRPGRPTVPQSMAAAVRYYPLAGRPDRRHFAPACFALAHMWFRRTLGRAPGRSRRGTCGHRRVSRRRVWPTPSMASAPLPTRRGTAPLEIMRDSRPRHLRYRRPGHGVGHQGCRAVPALAPANGPAWPWSPAMGLSRTVRRDGDCRPAPAFREGRAPPRKVSKASRGPWACLVVLLTGAVLVAGMVAWLSAFCRDTRPWPGLTAGHGFDAALLRTQAWAATPATRWGAVQLASEIGLYLGAGCMGPGPWFRHTRPRRLPRGLCLRSDGTLGRGPTPSPTKPRRVPVGTSAKCAGWFASPLRRCRALGAIHRRCL